MLTIFANAVGTAVIVVALKLNTPIAKGANVKIPNLTGYLQMRLPAPPQPLQPLRPLLPPSIKVRSARQMGGSGATVRLRVMVGVRVRVGAESVAHMPYQEVNVFTCEMNECIRVRVRDRLRSIRGCTNVWGYG